MATPTFVRIEYLNEQGEWWTGVAGTNVMDPAKYARGLGKRGKVARITETTPDGKDGTAHLTPGAEAEQQRRRGEREEAAMPKEDDVFAEFEEMLGNPGVETAPTETDPGNDLFIPDPSGRGTKDFIFNGHMGTGPSGAERWMSCTASLGSIQAFLETLNIEQAEALSESSEAARQGSTAHAAAEVNALLELGRMDQAEADTRLMELAVEPPDGEALDDEMREYITEYTDLIRQYAQDRGNERVLIEQRVSAAIPLVGSYEGEVYEVQGSGDCVVLPTEDEPELVIADLKYGIGVDVEADENPQLRLYALGALSLLVDDEGNLTSDIETIRYYIAQPRLGGIKTWEESLDDLLDWRDDVLSPALTAAVFGEGAEFVPSETACQFCPVRGTCAALAEERMEEAADLFTEITEAEFADGPGSIPDSGAMSDERLGELLAQVNGLIDLQKDLKAEAERRLIRGTEVPGFKLVSYTPPRRWKTEAAEELIDVDDMWQRKLITPAQAEKLLGEEFFDTVSELVDSPDKRPVVAPETDRRADWTGGKEPESMFDIEDD